MLVLHRGARDIAGLVGDRVADRRDRGDLTQMSQTDQLLNARMLGFMGSRTTATRRE